MAAESMVNPIKMDLSDRVFPGNSPREGYASSRGAYADRHEAGKVR